MKHFQLVSIIIAVLVANICVAQEWQIVSREAQEWPIAEAGRIYPFGYATNSQSGYATHPPDLVGLAFPAALEAVESELFAINSSKVEQIGPEYLSNLVTILRLPDLPNNKKVIGVYMLGQLHRNDTNVFTFLIDDIDLVSLEPDPSYDIPRWFKGGYSCVAALVEHGKPCVAPVLDRLSGEGNPLRRSLMCRVLVYVEGKDSAETQIKDIIRLLSDPLKKTTLEAALKEIDTK
jgi:hypothetical protein